jgi:hypothetical protein
MVKFYATWIALLAALPLHHFWTLKQGSFRFSLPDKRAFVAIAIPFAQAQQAQDKKLRPLEMSHADKDLLSRNDFASDEDKEIFRILSTANVIAVVGATNRESMPVYGVMRYLQSEVSWD